MSSDIHSIQDTRDVISSLRTLPGVRHVKANSTLGRHLIDRPGLINQRPVDPPPRSSEESGNLALIICIRANRSGWEFQYNDIRHVLEKQLKFQVVFLLLYALFLIPV